MLNLYRIVCRDEFSLKQNRHLAQIANLLMHDRLIALGEHLQHPKDMTQLTGDVSWSSGFAHLVSSLFFAY